MNFIWKKVTTSKSKYKPADFAAVKKQFLNDMVSIVTMEEIPPELICNWDKMGIHLVPVSPRTMEQAGSKWIEISGISSKQQITAVFCGSLIFLPVQLIYQGKTSRCNPTFDWFSRQAHYPFSSILVNWGVSDPIHWWEIILPYAKRQRDAFGDTTAVLVIMDNFKGQISDFINSLLEANNIQQPVDYTLLAIATYSYLCL